MVNIIKIQKGTKDILPQDIDLWYFMEDNARRIFANAGYKEIRTPIFESTDLFARGVGDTTDIVNKEMYTFEMNERSLTLRPENTAGVVRSFIENGMHRLSAPVKLWYKGPMFRYERPQAGRQRQFHQVGVEMFGIKDATADAEAIELAVAYLNSLGLNDLDVEINSLGCPTCRDNFKNNLKEVLKPYFDKLCSDCQNRYEKNPLRLLDCKVDTCNEIFNQPEVKEVIQSDFICDDCAEHFNKLKLYLDILNIKYSVNKLLVRGLDYYNRTVFEIKSNNLGSQNAVCGGGRYDTLVENLGGQPTPAIGFAMGMERLFSLIQYQTENRLDAYVVSDNIKETLKLTKYLRDNDIKTNFDFNCKKFTKQMEKASKVAKYAVILGEDEINQNKVSVKNLDTSEQVITDRENLPQILLT